LLSQHIVLAAFCKCGFFEVGECHKLFGIREDLVREGAEQLDAAQRELGALHVYTNKASDFTGQPKEKRYENWGSLESLPLRANTALRSRALELLKDEENARRTLLHLHPLALDEFAVVTATAVARGELLRPIVEREKGIGHGVLSQLAQLPDATNVAHRQNFVRVFSVLFGKCTVLAKKSPHYRELVADFHLLLLKRRYLALHEADSEYVRGKDIHYFIWNILANAQRMAAVERDKVAHHMIGDFKTYSLTPSGRKDPERVGAQGADEPCPENEPADDVDAVDAVEQVD
jgi:hypothetical protein